MSRRSLVTRYDAQLRGGRRLTMGPARQYSEAPVRPGAGPARLFALEPETAATVPQMTSWQTGQRMEIVGGNSPVLSSMSYPWDEGDRVPAEGADMIMIVSALGQPITLGPGWTVLKSGGAGSHKWAVGHRKWTAGATFDWTLGALTQDGPYEGCGYAGFAFEGMSGGVWDVVVVHDAVGQDIVFRDDPSPFRFGAICGFSAYTGWSGTAPDYGHANGLAGKVFLQDTDAPGWTTVGWFSTQHERACFRPTRPLPTGTYRMSAYGIAGGPAWANLIIRYRDAGAA